MTGKAQQTKEPKDYHNWVPISNFLDTFFPITCPSTAQFNNDYTAAILPRRINPFSLNPGFYFKKGKKMQAKSFHNNYNLVHSSTEEEFEEAKAKQGADSLTKVSDKDIEAIERLLDVKAGSLKDIDPFLFSSYTCECDKAITFYDFVLTALVDADHSKSFVLHTLLGNKYVIQQTKRFTRCSSCGRVGLEKGFGQPRASGYRARGYMCFGK